jgi:uncharacterized protein YigE (DUF2233 family)
MHLRLSAAALALIFFGAGCAVPPIAQNSSPAKTAPAPSWKNIAAGIDRYECAAPTCGVDLVMFRFAANSFAWRFENRSEPSTVEAWAASLPKAVFVANGVYFDENFQPTGLLKTAGAAVNARRYDLDKSGLLELSPAVAAIDTSAEKFDLEKMTEAGQNFPILIKSGQPVAAFKDERAARRTVFGTDQNGNVYVGAVAEDSVSFNDLAKLLAKTGVKWNNAINLDGGTSTGFSLHAGDYEESMNSIVQVPNVIVAERK